jgi:hypothetical protein
MNEITDTLIRLWKYDIEVFSQPWMYIPFLIPPLFYLGFFFVKWAVLTAPVWLPFYVIFSALNWRTTFNRPKP